MRARGDTAQIKRTEETLERLQEVDAKLVRSDCKSFHQERRINFFKNSEFATSTPPLRAERKTPFPFCLQDLIMAHLNIPQPEKMAEREAVSV